MNLAKKNWYLSSSGVPLDPLSQPFYTASGITDVTQKAAVNTLAAGLRSGSLLSSIQALWPIVGGTAGSHAVNLINPASFLLTFFGTVTHSANGMAGNGTTGYAKTGFIPSVQQAADNDGFSFYCRTNSTANGVDMGARDGGGKQSYVGQFGAVCFSAIDGVSLTPGAQRSDSLLTAVDTSSVTHKLYRAGSQVFDAGGSGTIGRPTIELYLMASNDSGAAAVFSNRQLAFACTHTGLTPTQVAALYTLVQAYQTTLGRQV